MPEDPQTAFILWLGEAIEAGIPEPHAMTLSTVDSSGCPDARILILKNVDDAGWHFAADAASAKGLQLRHNPAVALTFYWPKLGRQVRIRGPAASLGEAFGASDFLERSEQAKAVALPGRQSTRLERVGDLKDAIIEARDRLSVDPGLVSPTWSVYAVAPASVEFWQGASDRGHDRLRFTRDRGGVAWRKERLWP